jgi:CDP-glucose 4,6-dehydratase
MSEISKMNKFYKGKKVLVTGHTGFKGSWMTLWLTQVGAKVTGVSVNTPRTPSLFRLLNMDVDTRKCDITNYNRLYKIMSDVKPDIVLHLGARAILLESYRLPRETFMTNSMGSVNVMDAAYRVDSVKAVIDITTDKVYENNEKILAFKESDPLGGHDPYAASKACSEIAASSYRDSFYTKKGIGLSTARSGNVIGGGDWGLNRLVPNMVKAINKSKSENYFLKGNKVQIRPSAIRPWQYVLDVIKGYLMLGYYTYTKPEEYSGAWNFGPEYDSVKSVKEFSDVFMKAYGVKSEDYIEIMDERGKLHEDKVLILDSIKSRLKLGWRSAFGFEEMVRNTAVWYKNYYGGEKMDRFSKKHLEDYFNMED